MTVVSKEELVSWRRHLHMNPELSFHEEKTSQYIYDTLRTFPHLEVSRPTKYSVMARLIGNQSGKTIALRADIDALPIKEENTFDFISKNDGVMHACGHDGHTAMLLGVAKSLSERHNEIEGEVRFFFQHAEELFPGGAQEMVDAGVMDGVDYVIGAHLWSSLEVGKVGVIYGPAMASPDEFTIKIKGKGGHAAAPHETIDSIAIGAQLITSLQQVVSRQTNPLDNIVLSVTQFHAGTAHNIIPDHAYLNGTVRTFSRELSEATEKRMEQIVHSITSAFGATYEFSYEYGYRPVINEETTTAIVEACAKEAIGEEAVTHLQPSMGGEDFSAYLQKTKGTFFFVGAGNKERGITYPHHHPRFSIDEDALPIGVNVFIQSVFKLLKNH
jgi:amidohydrolase